MGYKFCLVLQKDFLIVYHKTVGDTPFSYQRKISLRYLRLSTKDISIVSKRYLIKIG